MKRVVSTALVAVLLTLTSCDAIPGLPGQEPPKANMVTIPADVSAGVAVFDRQTGQFTVQHNINQGYRSASLVKLLIVLDYLAARDVDAVSADSKNKLHLILKGSDDDAATDFYRLGNKEELNVRVKKMFDQAGLPLHDLATPSSEGRSGWGATTVSVSDMVNIYRYILEKTPEKVRKFMVDDLRQSAMCRTDKHDQSFGIQAVYRGGQQQWSSMQAWYEFAKSPKDCAIGGKSSEWPSIPTDGWVSPPETKGAVNWTGEVLHTTGTVGEGERFIVVVLTAYASGTDYHRAGGIVTQVVRSLPLPK